MLEDKGVLTIANKNSTPTVPGIKDLLLQGLFNNRFLGRPIEQISQRQHFAVLAARHPEAADLVAHGLRCLGTPLETLLRGRRLLGQEPDHGPDDRVLGC